MRLHITGDPVQEMVDAYPSDWAQTMGGLDGVEVPFTPVGEWSYAAAAMGFSAVFYFYASETAGGLDSFIDCLRDYCDTAGENLKRYSVCGGAFKKCAHPFTIDNAEAATLHAKKKAAIPCI